DIAQVGAEIPREALAGKLQVQSPTGAVQLRGIGEAVSLAVLIAIRFRIVEEPPRGRSEHLECKEGVVIQTQTAVNAGELIMLLYEIVAGCDQPKVRLIAYVAFDAQNSGVCVMVNEPGDRGKGRRIVSFVFAEVARRVVAGQQRAETRAPAFARHLQRHVG